MTVSANLLVADFCRNICRFREGIGNIRGAANIFSKDNGVHAASLDSAILRLVLDETTS
jgi:hypothetical protein